MPKLTKMMKYLLYSSYYHTGKRSNRRMISRRGAMIKRGDFMAEAKLTERQKRFADYYLELGNARQAAKRAGYSEDYGAQVMRNTAVRRYLESRLAQMDDVRVASAQEVLEYLTDVMRGDLDEDGKKGDRAATPRMKAAELLGKRLGIFNEISEGKLQLPVIIDDIGCDNVPEVDGR